MKVYRIVVTPGEPAGIGPDLIVQLVQRTWEVELVVCADPDLLQDRASFLKLPLKILPYNQNNKPIIHRPGTLTVLPISLHSFVTPGKLNVENSRYVVNTLLRACNGCWNKEFSALVTGPIHKGIINEAGIPFLGHTEFFAEHTKTSRVVMMMEAEVLRVALATTHLPVKKISEAITSDLLHDVINILHCELKRRFKIKNPHILVCGLNPHAGEDGYIGTEEINTIIPSLEKLRINGIRTSGPYPADTIFHPKYLNNADVVLAMYHDQGLPVLKYQHFNRVVNVTLGLPFIRTSVGHGTALDLATKGKADISSFIRSVDLAIRMILNTS